MAGQPPTASRRSSAETTELLLDAALHSVAAEGSDRSTLPVVAKRAGTSIGPLYSRFDNTDDLLAALWTAGLRDHLHTSFTNVAAWLTVGDEDARSWLDREITRPSTRSQALIETLATVRRYPYSGDTVVADASAAHRAFVQAVRPIPEVTAGYALAAVFGAMFLHPLLAPKARTDAAELLRIVRLLVAERPRADVVTDLVVTVPVPTVTGSGEVPDLFLNAALEVIGRGGYEHASSTRIARAAGLSASRVSPSSIRRTSSRRRPSTRSSTRSWAPTRSPSSGSTSPRTARWSWPPGGPCAIRRRPPSADCGWSASWRHATTRRSTKPPGEPSTGPSAWSPRPSGRSRRSGPTAP